METMEEQNQQLQQSSPEKPDFEMIQKLEAAEARITEMETEINGLNDEIAEKETISET